MFNRGGARGGRAVGRFYFPSTGAAAVSPTISATWTAAAGFVRRALAESITSTAFSAQSETEAAGPKCFRQYVSAPIMGQTISGNLRMQMRTKTDGSSDRSYLVVRVFNGAGTTVRGTLIDAQSTSDVHSALRNYTFVDTAVSSVSAQAGDILVIEYGHDRTGGGTSTVEIECGDNSATELPENETETAQYTPWIEFANPIKMQ